MHLLTNMSSSSESSAYPFHDSLKSLDIRTKTIELTLSPMLQQITCLVNRKQNNHSAQNGTAHIDQVSESVQHAVSQFVAAGEKVAHEHLHIKTQMLDACKQTSSASQRILDLIYDNKTKDLVSPVRQLLMTMYKVLVLADSVIIKEICTSKDKVVSKLDDLTQVANFTDFLNNFTSFGAEMAEFGKLTGERQLDTKRELDAAKIACLRGFLEKSTAVYLTSCKICLRHPTTTLSKDTRNTIVELMKKGLVEIVDVVCHSASTDTDDHRKILTTSLKEYMDALEMCMILTGDSTSISKAQDSFLTVDEYVHDFTDSAYTAHEHRELIILSCQKCQEELDRVISLPPDSDLLETTIENCQLTVHNLRRQLIQQTVSSAAELFGGSLDTSLLAALRSAAQDGEPETVENISSQIRDHVDQIQEVSKQMQHVSPTDSYYVRVKYTASYLLSLTELGAEVFCCHAMSKVAGEGYSAMADAWVMLIGELAAASEELQESLYQSPR